MKSNEAVESFCGLVLERFETCVIFVQLGLLRVIMQNDLCHKVFDTGKDMPYQMEAPARDQQFWRCVSWVQRFSRRQRESLCACSVLG